MSLVNIISAVGNNSSVYPLIVRDCGIEVPTKIAMTYNQNLKDSKQMANNALRERLIDEYGTSIVWLGGIPLMNAVADWGIKKLGYDPKVNVSLLKENGKQGLKYNIEKFKNLAPDEVKSMEKVLKNKSTYQKLLAGKFVLSTAIPIAIMGYYLPKFNFALTDKLRKKQENKFGVALEFSDSEDPEADSLYDQNEYTSFTVSGTEKPEKKFCIAFVGEGNLTKKGYSALFENVGKNLQEDLKARQQLIGDTVITCTATYKDGSQKSVDIKVGTEILTGKEAGIDTTAEGKDEVTEDMAAKKDVYTTFEVQQ